jgi:hypothetical protein
MVNEVAGDGSERADDSHTAEFDRLGGNPQHAVAAPLHLPPHIVERIRVLDRTFGSAFGV